MDESRPGLVREQRPDGEVAQRFFGLACYIGAPLPVSTAAAHCTAGAKCYEAFGGLVS